MNTTNATAGHGQHSHLVPTVPGQVVEIRDGSHMGTGVYFREGHGYYFVSYDNNTVERAERCILVVGLQADDLATVIYGCDLETPDGTFMIGIDEDDDLSWLSDGSKVLWDSNPL